MIRPCVLSRIEQRYDRTIVRINSGDVRALVSVTRFAAEGQIVFLGCPTVLLGNDVIDYKEELRVFLP